MSRRLAAALLGLAAVLPGMASAAPPPSTATHLPTNFTPGIEPSGDPLIQARVRAYVISFGRRAG